MEWGQAHQTGFTHLLGGRINSHSPGGNLAEDVGRERHSGIECVQ